MHGIYMYWCEQNLSFTSPTPVNLVIHADGTVDLLHAVCIHRILPMPVEIICMQGRCDKSHKGVLIVRIRGNVCVYNNIVGGGGGGGRSQEFRKGGAKR